MEESLERNLGLDLVRVTELSALAAGRWMGLGQPEKAHQQATDAMLQAINHINMDGYIVIGEESRSGLHSPLDSGKRVGRGNGLEMDVVVDPIDGTNLLVHGRSGAIAVAGVAPRGSMWNPASAAYMEKIVVNRQVAKYIVPECMDAPAAWTLALVARAKEKEVRDLVVFVLDRPRHAHLIEEIRMAGARVALRRDGDIGGAILAALPNSNIDILIGTGGVAEGITAACAVRALRGCMLGRLSPQSDEESQNIKAAGLEANRILACNELVRSDEIFFAATGITNGDLLRGVRYHGRLAETHSIVLRSETGTIRHIRAEHALTD